MKVLKKAALFTVFFLLFGLFWSGNTVEASPLHTRALYVGGEDIVADEDHVIHGGDGTATLTYDDSRNPVLTLDNYSYTGGGAVPVDDINCNCAILYDNEYGEPLTIVLKGNNQVKCNNNDGVLCGLMVSYGDIIICGEGSAEFIAGDSSRNSLGIMAMRNLLIQSGTINAIAGKTTGAYFSEGISAVGTIKITGGEITAKGGSVNGEISRSIGMNAQYSVEISGGKVTASGSDADKNNSKSQGIFISNNNGHITMTGGKVTATGGKAGGNNTESHGILIAQSGNISITGGSLTATGGEASGDNSKSYGIYLESGTMDIGADVTSVKTEGDTKAVNCYVKNGLEGVGCRYTGSGYESDLLPVNETGRILDHNKLHFPVPYCDMVFLPGAGYGSMDPLKIYVDEEVELPECAFEAPVGGKFSGWEVNGIDGEFGPGNKVRIAENCLDLLAAPGGSNAMPEPSVSVTAKWRLGLTEASIVKAPEGREGLIYNGSPQELLKTKGEAEGGSLAYAVSEDGENAPDNGWKTEPEKPSEPGTYYVWAKVRGDETHGDSDRERVDVVTIEKKKVTITAKDAKKPYDGYPLTEPGFTATALEKGDKHVFSVKMTRDSSITDFGTDGRATNRIAAVDGTGVSSGKETEVGNYLVTTVDGTLRILKADPVMEAPSAKAGLVYSRNAQELITPGSAEGGEMFYAHGDEKGATGDYYPTVPSGTEAGIYHVWYKVTGDGNHLDIDAKCLEVTIAPAMENTYEFTSAGHRYRVVISTNLIYSGKKQKSSVRISADGLDLTNKQYRVKYKNNKNAGDAKVSITPKKEYKKDKKVFSEQPFGFTILPLDVSASDVNVTYKSVKDGKVKGLKVNGRKVPKDCYRLNGDIIEFSGNYTGSYKVK